MASTIKVDNVQNQPGTNIINKCGTTITLGASSDTVALATGASQTGFGRTGTVDWVTTPKVTGDSPITAVTGKGYFLNTTAGTITINLPAGAAGSIVSMADYAATWDTYNVTVSPNGSEKIGGIAQNATLDTKGQSVTFVYVDAVQGWINTMDSTSNVRGQPPYMVASVSGACNTLATAPDCANMKIATFVNPGTFTVCSASSCASRNLVSHMIVAGGGGGAGGSNSEGGGGGGAGGYREVVSPSSPYTGSPLNGYPVAPNRVTVAAGAYPIVVGGGGPGGTGGPGNPDENGTNGFDSSFGGITSSGGGAGGRGNGPGACSGFAGGSGGGGGAYTNPGGTGNTPVVSPGQGSNGGTGGTGGPGYAAGGGGGASPTGGGNATTTVGGSGGPGETSSINGTPTARAGGGGGGTHPNGTGGSGGPGGGGTGKNGAAAGCAAAVNTGGGGGGTGAASNGGNGGSGIVTIRYKFQ
jgi:hypothetical protein